MGRSVSYLYWYISHFFDLLYPFQLTVTKSMFSRVLIVALWLPGSAISDPQSVWFCIRDIMSLDSVNVGARFGA